jgi:cytidine deaminase
MDVTVALSGVAGALVGGTFAGLGNYIKTSSTVKVIEAAVERIEQSCSLCRKSIHEHHEDHTKHVTMDLRRRIDKLENGKE